MHWIVDTWRLSQQPRTHIHYTQSALGRIEPIAVHLPSAECQSHQLVNAWQQLKRLLLLSFICVFAKGTYCLNWRCNSYTYIYHLQWCSSCEFINPSSLQPRFVDDKCNIFESKERKKKERREKMEKENELFSFRAWVHQAAQPQPHIFLVGALLL